MRWPHGKHNGRRIVGFHVEVKLDVTRWHWWPVFENQHGPIAVHWLCFYSWWNANFDYDTVKQKNSRAL